MISIVYRLFLRDVEVVFSIVFCKGWGDLDGWNLLIEFFLLF